MNKGNIEKQAELYFKNTKGLKSIFATESGHFFYTRDSRHQFIARSEKAEKPLDFHRDKTVKKEEFESIGLPEELPGVKVLHSKGFKTLKDVAECPDLTKVHGIGKNKAEEIKEYLKSFD